MNKQLFAVAAIFAAGASAQDVGSCDDPDYSCKLYNNPDFDTEGGYYEFCLKANWLGERLSNFGYSFISRPYGDFTNANMESWQCGSKVSAEFCNGELYSDYNQETGIVEWSCYSTLYQSGFGDEDTGVDPQLTYKNLANGVVLRGDNNPTPPPQNDSCITTLYTNDGCESNYVDGVEDKFTMVDDQSIGIVASTVEFAPKSVLMTEQSELKLYSEIRFNGGFMRTENMFYYDEEVDHCVCVKLTNENGDTYPINSLKYTKYNDNRGTESQ
jgi:hypothetical protein